jgi:hypothetical protein
MEGVLNQRITEVMGQATSHKGLGMSESAKKQTKVSLRKRIIRRIANGGTSPIVG